MEKQIQRGVLDYLELFSRTHDIFFPVGGGDGSDRARQDIQNRETRNARYMRLLSRGFLWARNQDENRTTINIAKKSTGAN
jgi:hypothetical protein